MFHWNNLLWPLIVSNTDKTIPIAVGPHALPGRARDGLGAADGRLGHRHVPVLIAYFAAQRWFVQGIAMSGFGGR